MHAPARQSPSYSHHRTLEGDDSDAGSGEKTAHVYSYVTGQQFRARVAAIVEAYGAMHEGLESEKRFLTRHWAKRSRHLELLISATAGMYGAFQAIAGKSLPEVEGLTALPEEGGKDATEPPGAA